MCTEFARVEEIVGNQDRVILLWIRIVILFCVHRNGSLLVKQRQKFHKTVSSFGVRNLSPSEGPFVRAWRCSHSKACDSDPSNIYRSQGCSPRGICLGSRQPRGSFFSWLGLASASHGLASVSTLLPRPRLCLIVSASVLARSGR